MTTGVRNVLKVLLRLLLNRLPSDVVKGKSPLHLTEVGEQVSEMIHAKEWVKQLVSYIDVDVKSMPPYKIQQFCYDYIQESFEPTDEEREKIDECSYEHGIHKDEVFHVLVIELRDALLNEK